MTSPIKPLGLSANQWQFLASPKKYIKGSKDQGARELVPKSTERQFKTARDILARLNSSHGVLLADDVGLGKTTVAALVAWVVASAGRTVRILAPNDVMARRWKDELGAHVVPLQQCAPLLNVKKERVKDGQVGRLAPGSIQVVKHSYAAANSRLTCDLLIIDEAHRAKGDNSNFSKALKTQKKIGQVLILTATPFSIHLDELLRMLTLIGGDAASKKAVRAYSLALNDLFLKNTSRCPKAVADRLSKKAEAAVEAISKFVIRHSIEDLLGESDSFGIGQDWDIKVDSASSDELELMMRMDRVLRVANKAGHDSSRTTNDPRFHVGWRHFDASIELLEAEMRGFAEPAKAVVKSHLRAIKVLRKKVGKVHSKMKAVSEAVKTKIGEGEKVVLFCHHHATAQELTVHLDSALPKVTAQGMPRIKEWKQAWEKVLDPVEADSGLRMTFINWLCADLIRVQVWQWIGPTTTLENSLINTIGRHGKAQHTIAEAAQHLFNDLLNSKSSKGVLRAEEKRAEASQATLMAGGKGTTRVLGVCEISDNEEESHLFSHNDQPDTIISIFNSPFGPDVLVVTDKLSEGIDLHRSCRHLIHYELNPSPIRTVQRNGRIRRVNSWASVTGEKILYAYPAFGGTRDHQLVKIMKKRVDSFSLLLGGVHTIDVEQEDNADDSWRNKVIGMAKSTLKKLGSRLISQEPGKR